MNNIIPREDKFIAVDLVGMKVFLYEGGEEVDHFDVISKGKPGSHWETPTGLYDIMVKEDRHFSSIGHVYMPYSMHNSMGIFLFTDGHFMLMVGR